MSKPDINVGEVAIDLSGETLILTPTLRATQAINRQFGSLTDALRRISVLDLDAYVAIVRHGANVKDAEQRTLAEKVFKAGMTRLSGPLAEYLSLLLHGGRPPQDEPGKSEEPEGNG